MDHPGEKPKAQLEAVLLHPGRWVVKSIAVINCTNMGSVFRPSGMIQYILRQSLAFSQNSLDTKLIIVANKLS